MRFSLKVIISFCLLAVSASAFAQAPGGDASGQPSAPAVAPGGPPGAAGRNQPPPGGRRFRRNGGFRDGMNGQGGTGDFSMNFDKADAASVVKFLSMISNVPIVIDPDLKGNITIISSKRISLQEAYQVVNAALNVRGYVMVGDLTSKVIQVVPLKKAIVDRTGVHSGKEITDGVTDQDLITQVIPLDYVSSDTLRDQLKTLVSSDQASLVSVASTNTLIITDNGGNVRRLMDIIKSVDKDTLGIIQVEVYQCKAASADSLATTLNSLFQPKQTGTAQGQPGQPGQPNQGGPNYRGGQPNNPQPVPMADVGLASLRGQVTFMSDARTNRLIVSATRDRIQMVLDLIKQLDVDTDPEVKIKFFPLQFADAQGAADMLNALFEQPQGTSAGASRSIPFFGGGGQASATTSTNYAGLKRNVVVADVRTNSIIVTATDQNMKQFENAIKELDERKDYSEVSRVYPLKYVQAANLAPVLTNLFKGPGNVSGGGFTSGLRNLLSLGTSTQNNDSPLAELQYVTVISEPKTNSLLVTGPPNSMPLLDDLVSKLDKRTAQVFIEVAIVDVTLSNENKFGVEWQWQDAKSKATLDLPLAATVLTGLKYSIINNNVSALLQALQTRSDVKVLSTPSVTTADNVQAKITIGQNVPYLATSSLQNGVAQNTTAYQPVAISLTVTPHVNGSSDVVGLDVDQTINEIISYNENLNAPIIGDREAQTSVNVRDGQSIVIGGIIQENKSKSTNGVPILSSIPLIGQLFRSRDFQTTRTELMVFLTPHILTTEDDVAAVNSQTRKSLSVEPPPTHDYKPGANGKTESQTAPSAPQPATAPPAAEPKEHTVPITPTGRS